MHFCWFLVLSGALLAGGGGAAPQERNVLIHSGGPPSPPVRRWHADVEPYESLCVMQGGVCRFAHDCPHGELTSIRGLCPLQKDAGVECCYARPKPKHPPRNARQSRNSKHYNGKRISATEQYNGKRNRTREQYNGKYTGRYNRNRSNYWYNKYDQSRRYHQKKEHY